MEYIHEAGVVAATVALAITKTAMADVVAPILRHGLVRMLGCGRDDEV
jgi:hypothetical protein